MSRPAKKSSAPARSVPAVSHDEVSREAFRIYQARHGAPGDPVADWCEAERIVLARRSAANPPRAAEAQAAAGSNGRRRGFTPRRRKR
jgi:hypothetical protein